MHLSPLNGGLSQPSVSLTTTRDLQSRFLRREETALLDVREEDPYAQAHPLWAANFPLSRLEEHALRRLPRKDVFIAVYGEHEGEDLAPRALRVLASLGFSNLHALEGGLRGWIDAGGEVFRDVNVPSKAFGELVEETLHTPSIPAPEAKAWIDGAERDFVVLDARRFDEYQTMSIPGGVSVPGGELVLRVRELAPDPRTKVIVNCAGRTRSIIGTQSLVNAGVPNPVMALRNGTIGWLLAGQTLDHGASRRPPAQVLAEHAEAARQAAGELARRAGVRRLAFRELEGFDEPGRTTYYLDVRSPQEHAAGHLQGFRSAPGGQLVQETDHHAPVRGARIVLDNDDDVRAPMAASWLAQMGWEVHVLEDVPASARTARTGDDSPYADALRHVEPIEATALAALLEGAGKVTVVDVRSGREHARQHVPGAWFLLRARLQDLLHVASASDAFVVYADHDAYAAQVASEIARAFDRPASYLRGGLAAWLQAGQPVDAGHARLASLSQDRYQRPYEGVDAPRSAMQGYLDWEFGLTAQLRRDGTHNFQVLKPEPS